MVKELTLGVRSCAFESCLPQIIFILTIKDKLTYHCCSPFFFLVDEEGKEEFKRNGVGLKKNIPFPFP